jgi:eukaryotic-like serine/threonine-protein kinase
MSDDRHEIPPAEGGEGAGSLPPEALAVERRLEADGAAWRTLLPADAGLNARAHALAEQAETSSQAPAGVATRWPLAAKGGAGSPAGPRAPFRPNRLLTLGAIAAAVAVVVLFGFVLQSLGAGRNSVGTGPTQTASVTATTEASPTVASSPTASPTASPTTPATPSPLPTATVSANTSPGTTVWAAPVSGSVIVAPALDNGVLFVSDESGRLHAFDAATGAARWTIQMSGPVGGVSMTATNGLIFARTRLDTLAAYRESDGSLAWGRQFPTLDVGTAAVESGVLYAVAVDPSDQQHVGFLYAFDPATGQPLWHTQLTGMSVDAISIPVPVVANGAAYVSASRQGAGTTSDNLLIAVSLSTHVILWSVGVTGRDLATAGSVVYVSGEASDLSGTIPLSAVEASTGTTLWSQPIANAGQAGGFLSPPLVSGGTVFVSTYGGYAYALDAASGAQRWGMQVGGTAGVLPVALGTTVYISSSNGLHALDAASGAQVWFAPIGSATSVAVGNGIVYVGSGGSVLALRA